MKTLAQLLVHVLAPAALLAACGSTTPSRFYDLAPVPAARETAEVTGGPRVQLGAIQLPRYLTRPELVTRRGPSQVEFADYDRWAGELQDLFAHTLAVNLAALLPSENVVRFPWEQLGGKGYLLTVSVARFDVEDGRALLTARWGLTDADGLPAATRRSSFAQAVEGDGPGAAVAALSDVLGELSREIAAAVQADAAQE